MAMQRCHVIKDTHNKQITSICYNPLKHEIVAGCEDGTIKTWDCVGDNMGKLTKICHEHDGWVNCLLYWPDAKVLLSAANDGKLIAWGSSMLPMSISKIGTPIYCMAWNIRRNHIVLGVNSALKVYTLKDPSKDGKMLADKPFVARDHTDLVKGVLCYETRVYSVGFDRKFCIYDSYAYPGKKGLKLVACLYPAHESGITTLSMAKDNENNTWLLTGSFDRTVKVWSQDGQVMHKFDGLGATVSGICYVPPTRTVWIAAGTSDVPMFDPKSGDNVADFSGTFQNKEQDANTCVLTMLLFIPDLNQVVASDTRKQICIWRHNPTGCITALRHKNAVEALTYTRKIPLLVFSGDGSGQIMKWERLQSNHFMYSKERLSRGEGIALLTSQIAEKYEWAATDKRQIREQFHHKTSSDDAQVNVAVMKLLFVEELDLLIAASEDNNIYVWGFDYNAVDVLQTMKPKDDVLCHKFAFLLQQNGQSPEVEEEILNEPKGAPECDSVTNRVAGFICKAVFTHHKQCVTGLAIVPKTAERNTTYLISVGWDRRIYIWNLDKLSLHDVFRHNEHKEGQRENCELAADGIIVDLVYCQERDEFAYSSADKLVYIRAFSDRGTDMKLKAVLQGHEAEVTQVRWNNIYEKWVTGSDDCTIRVWSKDGLTCELVLSTVAGITAMCIDQFNGCIVAGVQDTIRVYDMKAGSLVQTNVGHADSIRNLIHIPERQQYVSASWDKTVRVWNAYKGVKKRDSNNNEKELLKAVEQGR